MRCKASGKVSNGNTGHRRAHAKALCSVRHAGVTFRDALRNVVMVLCLSNGGVGICFGGILDSPVPVMR